MPKPDLATIPEFYHSYVKRVNEDDASTALQTSHAKTIAVLQRIPDEKWDFRYAVGKWSIKEMVQHIIDAERIFAYRALCIARGEQGSLPGFDENTYAANSNADSRGKKDLLEEWDAVRSATILLFNSFNDEQINRTGIANNKPISVNGIGFVTSGHVLHHLQILEERYLQ